MLITLMTTDRKWVTPLPIVPEDLKLGRAMSHQTVETINAGEILIKGKRKLIEFTINSFLPTNKNDKKKYAFAKTNLSARTISFRLELWRNTAEPIRVIVTDDAGRCSYNILMLIESYEEGIDRTSDLIYELKLKQYIDYS